MCEMAHDELTPTAVVGIVSVSFPASVPLKGENSSYNHSRFGFPLDLKLMVTYSTVKKIAPRITRNIRA